MSGVWGEPKNDGGPVRNDTQDWERERIADLNHLRNERLQEEERLLREARPYCLKSQDEMP